MKTCYKIILFTFLGAILWAIIALGLGNIANTQGKINYCKFNIGLPSGTQNLILDEPMGEPEIIDGKNNINKEESEKPKDKQKIKVTGNGTISVKPEIAKINFAIETLAGTMAEANVKHQAKAKALLSVLQGYDVVSAYYNCYPIYNYENEKHLTGYQIYSGYELTTENLNGIDGIINIIILNGGTNVNDVEYYLKDNSTSYYSALTFALNDAQTKAMALIDEGMHLKVKSIKEQNYFYCPYKLSLSTNANARQNDVLVIKEKEAGTALKEQGEHNSTQIIVNGNENLGSDEGGVKNEQYGSTAYKNIEITANIEVEFWVTK